VPDDVAAVASLSLRPSPLVQPAAHVDDDPETLAHLPILLVDVTSLSRGAVSAEEGQSWEELDGEQQQLALRLLRLLSEARDFDSQCDAFLYQHAFCRMSCASTLARDLRSYSQSLPASHVIRPLTFPPLVNGVSASLMQSRICSSSPYTCVVLIKQLLKQCLRPLHWKYACCMELESMAAHCASAPPPPPPHLSQLPDFQFITPPPPPSSPSCNLCPPSTHHTTTRDA
jgi:hypothetical protein